MPPPGNYIIRNRGGADLVVTFTGVGGPLIVIPPNGTRSQVWTVAGPDGEPQSITPVVAPGEQTAPQGDFVSPIPGPFQWMILQLGPGFGILNEAKRGWSINVSAPGQRVTLIPFGGALTQFWTFQPAP